MSFLSSCINRLTYHNHVTCYAKLLYHSLITQNHINFIILFVPLYYPICPILCFFFRVPTSPLYHPILIPILFSCVYHPFNLHPFSSARQRAAARRTSRDSLSLPSDYHDEHHDDHHDNWRYGGHHDTHHDNHHDNHHHRHHDGEVGVGGPSLLGMGSEKLFNERIMQCLADCFVAHDKLLLSDCELSFCGKQAFRAISRALRRKYITYVIPSVFVSPKLIQVLHIDLSR